jgi:NAD(P)-dependent dehydrogenase (short-subunit alcohol dehydrogenase family)
MMAAFKDQVALVTGASKSIGRAIALGLAAEDATVCLVGRDLAALDAVAESAERGRPRPVAHRADVTSDDDIRGLAERLHHEFGRLDLLVYGHGNYLRGPVASVPAADLDLLYRVNVRSIYVLTQFLLPLVKASRGQIVFVNSSVVETAKPELSQYAATKRALRALADSLRQEVNPEGVRVLAVYPGRTATPRQSGIHALEGKPYHPEWLIQPEDVAFMVISALKVARTTEVTDIHLRPMIKPA